MPLRAIIIDDEQKGINTLKILIANHVPDLRVVAECTRAANGIVIIEDYKPEIVFLDINMPQMDGFGLLSELKWKEFSLVFTTAHPEHALRALKNNAVDYLLKPIDPEDLLFAVNKIRRQMTENSDAGLRFNYPELLRKIKYRQKLILSTKTGIEHIDLDEVVVFESVSNYTKIHLTGGREISSSKTLKSFEAQICEQGGPFMRVHHSYIINLSKVSRYLKIVDRIVMENDQKVPLSKSRKDAFYSWLNI